MRTGQITSPLALARNEFEKFSRGAASIFSEAKREIEESSVRVAELEAIIETKDCEVRRLKQAVVEKDLVILRKDEQIQLSDKRTAQLSNALRALTHEHTST